MAGVGLDYYCRYMLIFYLTGYPPAGDTGGGGLANSSLIDKGIELGHTIDIYTAEDEVPDTKPDLYWLSNMNGRFSLEFINRITDGWSIPFVVQDDGYQNLCPQPTRKYLLCFQDRFLEDDWDGYLDVMDIEQLYLCHRICRCGLMHVLLSNCKASISVSPMHGDIWRSIFPQITGKQVIVEPQIDTELFRVSYPPNMYSRVPGTYLYVGTVAEGKGYCNCIDYVDRQGGKLITCGDIHHTVARSDVRNWMGNVPQRRLPSLYSTCEYFIHLPNWPEPQGRAVTEALLCGCRVIANNKVGALSYPWLEQYINRRTYGIAGLGGNYQMIQLSRNAKEFRGRIADAPAKFWRDVDEYL